MRIAVLQPSREGSTDNFAALDPPCDPSRYLPEHECVPFAIRKQTAVKQVIQIAREGFDVAINLCDGAWHGDTAGIEVVQALEKLNAAFTGAGSAFFDPSREAMKMACHAAGVNFPAYVMARSCPEIARALDTLRFPMLVKHPQGYSSEGLTPSSRVTDADALRSEAEGNIAAYGAALIEEFIEGREFTVLVTEARNSDEEAWALTPIEFLFPEGECFKHFDLKWKDYGRMTTGPVEDSGLAGRLREMSSLAFVALGGSGYARCDIRMDREGELYLLEVNPNCAVFYPPGEFGSADFILDVEPGGHRAFLLHQIECALRRQSGAMRAWELRYVRSRGFGLYASRAIASGEMVERYEERPQTLVSRGHVERHWRGLKRRWFAQYCWSIGDGIHGMWSLNPEDWRPINHSCDPNTAMRGLDLLARRGIAAGEEITVDYATFSGPEMEPFECRCGSAMCRGVIGGERRGQ